MVLLKPICPPDRRKALIAITAKPSTPTLSISNPAPFQLLISLHVAATTRPSHVITMCTDGTVFKPAHPDSELDTLARGTVSLTSADDPARKINLGRFLAHHARRNAAPDDLKKRPGTDLLMVPAEGEVEVVHELSLARVFRYEQQLRAEDVIGETWRLKLNDGFVGCTWWCWGDLDGELKGRPLSAWHEGMWEDINPKPNLGPEWVTGCDPVELVFEDCTREECTFRFVE